MRILEDTLNHLLHHPGIEPSKRSITGIQLGNYFSVVQLDDGSTGAAMSYYQLDADRLSTAQAELEAMLPHDPLLLDRVRRRRAPTVDDAQPMLERSIFAAVLGALSDPLIRSGGDQEFSVSHEAPPRVARALGRLERASAVVVGFGGYLEKLAEAPMVEALHVLDLAYGEPDARARFDAALQELRRRFPGKTITISDGSDTSERLRGPIDIVSITGSTLANGSLEELLADIPAAALVVLQGPTTAIHPHALFAAGVDVVATELKPPELLAAAAAEPVFGRKLHEYLEGQLPPVYLLPRRD